MNRGKKGERVKEARNLFVQESQDATSAMRERESLGEGGTLETRSIL